MKYFCQTTSFISNQIDDLALPVELLPILQKLTHVRRGWEKRGIHEDGTVEIAIQHVAKTVKAACCLDGNKWQVDQRIVRKQVLIHELPEVVGPDYTPGEIEPRNLHMAEKLAVEKVLPENFPQREEIIKTWLEFEQRETAESSVAFSLDKMDAYVSSEYYGLINPEFTQAADEFFGYTYSHVTDARFKSLMTQLKGEYRKLNPKTRLRPGKVFSYYFSLL